jgi:hypothetical protein
MDPWGKAQQRLILYLQSLGIPPFEVLELALEALKAAKERRESGDNAHPVTAAVRALRQILFLRKPTSEGLKPETKRMMLNLPYLEESELSCAIKSAPPLNRGTMVPEKARKKLASHPASNPAPS